MKQPPSKATSYDFIDRRLSFFRMVVTMGLTVGTMYLVNQGRLTHGWAQIGKWSGWTFLGMFLVEHYTRTAKKPFYKGEPPSYYLNRVSQELWSMFYTLGVYWTTVSGFIYNLKLDKLIDTLYVLVKPMVKISLSWVNFVYGYVSEMGQYRYPIIVALSSCGIGATGYYGRYYMDPEWVTFIENRWELVRAHLTKT